jgi:hypothetical protein
MGAVLGRIDPVHIKNAEVWKIRDGDLPIIHPASWFEVCHGRWGVHKIEEKEGSRSPTPR